MAATDKVQIFFTKTGDRFWTNVFHVNAVDLDAAAGWANTVLVSAMTANLSASFTCVKTIVDHLADDSFVTTPLSQAGLSSAGDELPLFNTIKVDIAVAGHGRNDGKFVRGWLNETVIEDGVITDSARTVYQAVFDDLIADSSASGVDLVDADGNLWLTASVRKAVQERQLHRRRKRVVVP
jgi:hypothetical protein